MQQIVLIDPYSHVLLPLVVVCEFYVRRLAPVLKGLEQREVVFVLELLIGFILN